MSRVSAVAPPGSLSQELGRLVTLSWPVSLGGIGMLGMGMVDTAMVGPLGEDALAALAAATLWIHGLGLAARGILMGQDPIVSQAFGRGDRALAGAALRAGLAVALLVGLALVAAHQLTAVGLAALGQPREVLPDAQRYATAVGFGVPGFLAFWALRQFLQGLGRMRPATVAILVANGLNVLLNGSFVHGWFGAPALGVVGAGWATAGSSWCLFLTLAVLERRTLAEHLRAAGGRPILTEIRRVLSYGIPIAAQLALEVWAFIGAGVIIGWLGTTALAAHQVALLLASVAFMVPLGVSAGATTRVGNLIGAGWPWQRSAWVAVALGTSVMTATGFLFLTVPRPLAALFIPAGPARDLCAALLPIAGAFQLFDGLQVTCHGILRGIGDVRVPTLFNIVAFWFLTLPLAFVLATRTGAGAVGVWWALVLGLATVSGLLVGRVAVLARRGRVSATGTNPRAA